MLHAVAAHGSLAAAAAWYPAGPAQPAPATAIVPDTLAQAG